MTNPISDLREDWWAAVEPLALEGLSWMCEGNTDLGFLIVDERYGFVDGLRNLSVRQWKAGFEVFKEVLSDPGPPLEGKSIEKIARDYLSVVVECHRKAVDGVQVQVSRDAMLSALALLDAKGVTFDEIKESVDLGIAVTVLTIIFKDGTISVTMLPTMNKWTKINKKLLELPVYHSVQ